MMSSAGYRFRCSAIVSLMIGLALLGLGVLDPSYISAAEQSEFELESPAAVFSTLTTYVGKRVTVQLKSGHEFTGTVTRVG